MNQRLVVTTKVCSIRGLPSGSRANPMIVEPFELSGETLRARPRVRRRAAGRPAREIAKVTDDIVAGVRVRIYEHDAPPTGLIVYFHGGGFCIGSVGLMDNVARDSRTAPAPPSCPSSIAWRPSIRTRPVSTTAKPSPDGRSRTRSGSAHRRAWSPSRAEPGGNLYGRGRVCASVVTAQTVAGQVLIYPVVDGDVAGHASRRAVRRHRVERKTITRSGTRVHGSTDLAVTRSWRPCTPRAWAACRPRSSCSEGATRYATKAACTPVACAKRCRGRRGRHRGSPTDS